MRLKQNNLHALHAGQAILVKQVLDRSWTKLHPEHAPQTKQPSCLARRTGNSSKTGAGQKRLEITKSILVKQVLDRKGLK